MNKLEATIIDQHRRIQSAGEYPAETLQQMQEEVLAAATPELTQAIIDGQTRTNRIAEPDKLSLTAMQDPRRRHSHSTYGVRVATWLAQEGFVAPNQGYVGGLINNRDGFIVYGRSMDQNGLIKQDDPIQEAMGSVFYPPVMWVKALQAAAYQHRPESAQQLSVPEYLTKLGVGFALGSMAIAQGNLLGATGFMPGERLAGAWDTPLITEHVSAEPIAAFKLSGLCDQAVVDPDILIDTPTFATAIIEQGGNLN